MNYYVYEKHWAQCCRKMANASYEEVLKLFNTQKEFIRKRVVKVEKGESGSSPDVLMKCLILAADEVLSKKTPVDNVYRAGKKYRAVERHRVLIGYLYNELNWGFTEIQKYLRREHHVTLCADYLSKIYRSLPAMKLYPPRLRIGYTSNPPKIAERALDYIDDRFGGWVGDIERVGATTWDSVAMQMYRRYRVKGDAAFWRETVEELLDKYPSIYR